MPKFKNYNLIIIFISPVDHHHLHHHHHHHPPTPSTTDIITITIDLHSPATINIQPNFSKKKIPFLWDGIHPPGNFTLSFSLYLELSIKEFKSSLMLNLHRRNFPFQSPCRSMTEEYRWNFTLPFPPYTTLTLLQSRT
ncbi:hypothetical protein HanRHA438_Chr13g0585091 [Helianthus annuus]|nr:hypothetical protein HanIR_Chr13g0625041 [Helianthus annuus]KAJ0857007.1 hypothetical protein HanRHA438_Chr13g0585091 [Helianthus annuus]